MIILTDLSEVLVHGLQGIEHIVEERYGERTGEKFYKRCIEMEPLFLSLLRGNLCEEAFWKDFLLEDYWPFNFKDSAEMFEMNLKRPRIPGALEVYQAIKKHPERIGSDRLIDGRPKIYVVSDHITERVPLVKAAHRDVFDAVDGCFWSCDIGMVKSDRGFFDVVLDSLGVSSDEVVLVDDWSKNTSAARRKKIASIEFQDSIQLMCELKELGFVF